MSKWAPFKGTCGEGGWEDCSVGFRCPACNELLFVDSQNGDDGTECCGKRYRLVVAVQVRDGGGDG